MYFILFLNVKINFYLKEKNSNETHTNYHRHHLLLNGGFDGEIGFGPSCTYPTNLQI